VRIARNQREDRRRRKIMNTASLSRQYGAAALIMATLGVCALPQTHAQTEPQPQPVAQLPLDVSKSPPAFYVFAGFAALYADENSQLTGESGSPINLIAGGGYRFSPNLAAELNILFAFRTLDTPSTARPPAGTYASGSLDSSIWTGGIAATLKYRFPAGRVAPYLGVGVGYYWSHFLTTSEATGCVNNCDDTGPRVEADSSDVGAHVVGGADYHFTAKDVLAVEIRYLKLKADFGAVVPGEMDLGGTFFWMGYRRYF
jgi:opacity protein-like surface antigen